MLDGSWILGSVKQELISLRSEQLTSTTRGLTALKNENGAPFVVFSNIGYSDLVSGYFYG